jgi:hypothetical protein
VGDGKILFFENMDFIFHLQQSYVGFNHKKGQYVWRKVCSWLKTQNPNCSSVVAEKRFPILSYRNLFVVAYKRKPKICGAGYMALANHLN